MQGGVKCLGIVLRSDAMAVIFFVSPLASSFLVVQKATKNTHRRRGVPIPLSSYVPPHPKTAQRGGASPSLDSPPACPLAVALIYANSHGAKPTHSYFTRHAKEKAQIYNDICNSGSVAHDGCFLRGCAGLKKCEEILGPP